MHKYNYFFIFLTCVVISSILYGFKLTGSPLSQKYLKEDSDRLTKMSSIKYSVENYFREYQTLPVTLDELSEKNSITLAVDPKTQKPFEYKIVNPNSYSLCAIFATDTKNPSSPNYKSRSTTAYLEDTNTYHSKGYDCITYKLGTNIVKLPTSSTSQSNLMIFYGNISSIAKTDTGVRFIINENSNIRIVNAVNSSTSAFLNQRGDKVDVSYFKVNDKVIIDASYDTGGYPNRYTATQIQSLDR